MSDHVSETVFTIARKLTSVLNVKLKLVEGAKHAIPLYILYRFWNTVFVIIKFCKDCVLHIPVEYQEEYSAKHLLPINGS